MNNPFYQQKVLDSLTFQLQERMGFTQILFPFHGRDDIEITGSTVDNFASLPSRIKFGKELYMILFSEKNVQLGAVNFGKAIVHSGSRSDYMPEVFSTEAGSLKVFSPYLEKAWPDYQHKSSLKVDDWFSFEKASKLTSLYTLPETEDTPNMKKNHLLNILQLSSLGEVHKMTT